MNVKTVDYHSSHASADLPGITPEHRFCRSG